MVSFSRLVSLASRVVEKAAPSSSHPSGAGGGRTDWRDVVRSAANAVTGDGRAGTAPGTPAARPSSPTASGAVPPSAAAGSAPVSESDRAAIARYDYLLRTADPDRVEEIHREAFARLSPTQRAQVRERMDAELTASERPRSDSAHDLARTAARAEAAQPGRMSTILARAGRGGLVGAGIAGAGGLLAAVAGGAVVSAVAAPLLAQAGQMGVDFVGLAEGVDLEALASGADLTSLAGGTDLGEWAGGAQDAVSGAGEQIGGWGERLSNLDIPGFGDFLGR